MKKKHLFIKASVEYLVLFQNNTFHLSLENKVYFRGKNIDHTHWAIEQNESQELNSDIRVSLWAKICSLCF